ncbi:MAG: hypothetical protein LC781_20930, partial [Actinobacteria bacterium]|nr:hypothetical protein [Actinomycetota bacterium]
MNEQQQTPFGRAGEPTREIPLGRPLGRVDEEGHQSGRDEETPLGQGFVPGDLARIEVGFFRHEMNLKEVFAYFEHEDDAEHAIALRGEPQETDPPTGGTKFSGVSLRATVPADAAPGVYRFRRLEAETYGGRRLPFDQS